MPNDKPLIRNRKSITPRDFISLSSMFAPPILFSTGLLAANCYNSRFAWVMHPMRWPWEMWVLAISGTIATAGGLGDWLFHRTFVTVGPQEHRSHLLALASGGVPLFALMATASVVSRPQLLLVPIIVTALYTTALICFDEFVFHRHRCKPIETLMHRLLVFGNAVAWLAWMNWCFVRNAANALSEGGGSA